MPGVRNGYLGIGRFSPICLEREASLNAHSPFSTGKDTKKYEIERKYGFFNLWMIIIGDSLFSFLQ